MRHFYFIHLNNSLPSNTDWCTRWYILQNMYILGTQQSFSKIAKQVLLYEVLEQLVHWMTKNASFTFIWAPNLVLTVDSWRDIIPFLNWCKLCAAFSLLLQCFASVWPTASTVLSTEYKIILPRQRQPFFCNW